MGDSHYSWVCNARLWPFGSHEFTEFARLPEPMISKGILVNITANLTTHVLKHQKILGVLSISQGANEQFPQFRYSSFLEFFYWQQTPAFTFLEMTVLLCSFFQEHVCQIFKVDSLRFSCQSFLRVKIMLQEKGPSQLAHANASSLYFTGSRNALCKLSMCWRETMYWEMHRH